MLLDCHKAFESFYRDEMQASLPEEVIALRKRLMDEEVSEWARCFVEDTHLSESEQKRHRAKELADILYVVFGTIVSEGLQSDIERVFEEVHNSNMSKLENGKPLKREDGKFLKGKDYKEPDLSFIK